MKSFLTESKTTIVVITRDKRNNEPELNRTKQRHKQEIERVRRMIIDSTEVVRDPLL